MTAFIVRRSLQAIPTLLGITVIAFFIMWAAPGNPASELLLNPNMTQRQKEAFLEVMGYNDPFYVQYTRWLIGDAPIKIAGIEIWGGRQIPVIDRRGNIDAYEIGTNKGVIRGDFGKSFQSKRPALEVIRNHLLPTLRLGVSSLLIGIFIGIPVGVLAAVNQGGIFDQITRVMTVIVSAIPVFWLGLILLLIFGSWLQWLPMGNDRPLSMSGEHSLTDILPHYVLPVFTLSSFSIAAYSRYMRASVLEVLSQDYIRTAHAKGLAAPTVWFNHATRNALIPAATLLGQSIPNVVAGAVLTETIYAWPGMGRLTVNSVLQQDYSIIMAVVILFGVLTILGYLLSDILYAVLDPRVRLS